MIFTTVTLNPSLDRFEYLNGLEVGGLNRPYETKIKAGGKGINVARALSDLKQQEDSCEASIRAITFAGGFSGEELTEKLQEESFQTLILPSRYPTRQSIKLVSPQSVTEINESAKIGNKELLLLIETLADLMASGQEQVVLLSGSTPKLDTKDSFSPDVDSMTSFPQNVEKCVENLLITVLESCGIPVIVDTSGESLVESLKASPSLIKPNQIELEALYGGRFESEKMLVDFCRELYVDNGCEILCTRGENGSVFVGKEGIFKKASHRVFPCDPTGAGDTYLAAFCFARYQKKLSVPDSLTFADGYTREYLESRKV